MLLGADPRHYQALFTAMNEQMRFAPMGISGVDMALWDLRGKIYGDNLPNLLGGAMRETVDCYASPIPYLPTAEATAQYARDFVAQGFRAVKLKIGRGLGVDIEHVEAARNEIGGDIKLLVDANGAYTVSESLALAKDLVRLGVYWLEEPVHPEYPKTWRGYGGAWICPSSAASGWAAGFNFVICCGRKRWTSSCRISRAAAASRVCRKSRIWRR